MSTMRITMAAAPFALVVVLCACRDKGSETGAIAPVKRVADAHPVTALSYWTGVKPGDLGKYPAPVAVTTVARAVDIPRIVVVRPEPGAKPLASGSNTSVQLDVIASG